MKNDENCPAPDAAPLAMLPAAADRLARLKRASLHEQAQRSLWQLGALARRVEHEAPEVQARLRAAVEAMQLVCARLGLAVHDDRRPAPRRSAGAACWAWVGAVVHLGRTSFSRPRPNVSRPGSRSGLQHDQRDRDSDRRRRVDLPR